MIWHGLLGQNCAWEVAVFQPWIGGWRGTWAFGVDLSFQPTGDHRGFHFHITALWFTLLELNFYDTRHAEAYH
jgi:hypothetical protein